MNGTSIDTVLQILKWIVNTLFHQCVAVVAVYTIWIPIENYSAPFSWHVILCTLGLFPIVAECLILFSKQNVWSQEIDRKQKYWIHAILISIGAFLIIFGTALETYRKAVHTDPNVKNFESAHAITGLIGIIFIVFAMVCGLLAFNTQRIYRWKEKFRPIYFKFAHNVIGQTAYLFCLISFCLGYFTPWFVYYTSEASRISATVVSVIVAFWSTICAWRSLVNQIRSLRNVDN
ncbi:hypothetical protein PPYR_00412 [Photinus pyralis]|uniref:ascorbate ferrireductase (transmembrane) n=1 Tax=Photinus pyralis TaxID=7054 RepID=A0A5N4B1G3_PHOPY|nr:uncharacterized protein LOC116159933 [Photinus pyralis]KAB0803442.1 hypothetical protein PPYR_00412 [Photinus pyralis]